MESTHAGELIYVAGWNTAHRPVHPLAQSASAPALVLKFNVVNIVIIDSLEIGKGEFSPPAGLGFMLKLVIYFSDEFIVADSV